MDITLKYDEFTARSTKTKRSALGKRFEMPPGLLVKYEELPAEVIQELLNGAIEDFLVVPLKTMDKDTCTKEEVQAAMQARLDILKAGAIGTSNSPRKAPTQDPVKKEARAILKAAIQGGSDEKLDGRVLTSAVANLFKAHTAFLKAKKAEDAETMAEYQGIYDLVEDALKKARAKLKEQEKLSASLAPLVSAAKAASKEAAKKKAPKAEKAATPAKPKAKAKPAAKAQ